MPCIAARRAVAGWPSGPLHRSLFLSIQVPGNNRSGHLDNFHLVPAELVPGVILGVSNRLEVHRSPLIGGYLKARLRADDVAPGAASWVLAETKEVDHCDSASVINRSASPFPTIGPVARITRHPPSAAALY